MQTKLASFLILFCPSLALAQYAGPHGAAQRNYTTVTREGHLHVGKSGDVLFDYDAHFPEGLDYEPICRFNDEAFPRTDPVNWVVRGEYRWNSELKHDTILLHALPGHTITFSCDAWLRRTKP